MNPFVHKTAAKRYAESRPYHQNVVMERVRTKIPLAWPVEFALDVGCGTGQSCRALRTVARRVMGVDASAEMLEEAPVIDGVEYRQADAEQLPTADASCDLVTVSSAFHWFNRERFLKEAHRVIKPKGWLVVYNNAFKGRMKENPDYSSWLKGVYMKRYLAPPRQSTPLTKDEASAAGFDFVVGQNYSNDVIFDAEGLTRYLTTHSNIIAAVENGAETLESAYDWLLNSVRPYFTQQQATFEFGGPIWYLQKL